MNRWTGIIRHLFRTKKPSLVKIFLVDDHAILRDGVKSLLEAEDELSIVGEASTAEEALEQIPKTNPDLLVCDFGLPGMDGLTLIRRLKRVLDELKIILLSMHDETHLVKEILKAGVDGYVLKKDTHKELKLAIKKVQEGELYLSNDINKLLITDLKNPDEGKLLTDREREILDLIAQEYTNKMIAEELFISERTVETHRKNIFKKTGTNSIVGLIKFAYANNLI
jgi:DNA-binding NarL/FixJ family response regulator